MIEYSVRPKPWWLWWHPPGVAITIGRVVYLSPVDYRDFSQPHRYTPKEWYNLIAEHEAVHVKQWQRERGFGLRYLLSRKFRARMELEAYRSQLFRYRNTAAYDFLRNRFADHLASAVTLWAFGRSHQAYARAWFALKEPLPPPTDVVLVNPPDWWKNLHV